MDIDEVFDKIGHFGPYQRKLCLSIGCLQFLFAFHMIHMVFIGAEPNFYCAVGGVKLIRGCPASNETCEKATFTGSNFTSIVSEVGTVIVNT